MDATNSGVPEAGGQLSGEATRQAAIKRLQREQSIRKPSGMSPNTGGTGLPKPGLGLQQNPGNPSYSPHPPKPRRI